MPRHGCRRLRHVYDSPCTVADVFGTSTESPGTVADMFGTSTASSGTVADVFGMLPSCQARSPTCSARLLSRQARRSRMGIFH
ncbi:unnamed protein product [Heligmosomoides polygyrus]|uniref:AMP-binding enzyme family protein n=1 Tax=Heligmosomoides polygyrus TaxID=6339 RepID=A0A183G1I9_HELPZ|nr:unnamed protein product [Heligmosomoides polygyrus]